MKTTHKKLIGGLIVGLFVATVGAALATEQTDDITDDATDDVLPQMLFLGRREMIGLGPYASELTEGQKTEREELMINLREQNATCDEIRAAIRDKFDEFGVFDTRLDNEIVQTEQRFTILNRRKELRNEGYSWDEINNIIDEEFDLQNTTGGRLGIMSGHYCRQEPGRESQDLW